MTAIEESPSYGIRFTFVDDLKNGFTTLGGAAWETVAEQAQAWAAISALADGDDSDFIADLLGVDGINVIEEKRISAETCEQLMGKSIAELIADGREKTWPKDDLTDDDLCALQYVRQALQAIAERKKQVGDVIEPVADIRTAAKLAKEALRRLHPLATRLQL